jgi:hypothetical protein
VVSDVPDLHSSFLPHLPLDGVLERLAWFDEASKRGVELAGEFFLLRGMLEETARLNISMRTFLPRRTFSPDSSMASMMTTGSVRG